MWCSLASFFTLIVSLLAIFIWVIFPYIDCTFDRTFIFFASSLQSPLIVSVCWKLWAYNGCDLLFLRDKFIWDIDLDFCAAIIGFWSIKVKVDYSNDVEGFVKLNRYTSYKSAMELFEGIDSKRLKAAQLEMELDWLSSTNKLKNFSFIILGSESKNFITIFMCSDLMQCREH